MGIRRAGNTWTSLNPNQTGNLDLNWAASFPTGSQKGGLYNYSNSRYAQLMTNRNIPVIGSSGRSVAEIGEGDLELVPVNYYGRLWDNQTRTTFQGGGKRIQYLGSYAADPSALYKAKGNTNFTIGSDGHPVARSTDDIVFQENNNVNGWDINEVRSYYYWVHDKTKRSLGNAQGRAHNYGGDLASFNPKGVTNSNNWWFDYIMMKKATKETLRPYTIKQTYLPATTVIGTTTLVVGSGTPRAMAWPARPSGKRATSPSTPVNLPLWIPGPATSKEKAGACVRFRATLTVRRTSATAVHSPTPIGMATGTVDNPMATAMPCNIGVEEVRPVWMTSRPTVNGKLMPWKPMATMDSKTPMPFSKLRFRTTLP